MKQLSLLLVGITLFVAGCGGDRRQSSISTDRPQTQTQHSQTGSSVRFTSPTTGDNVDGTFTARVQVKQFEVSSRQMGKAAQQGQGHIHFSLDEGKYDTAQYAGASGKLSEKLGVDGKYSVSVKPEITYTNIPPGKHTLKVVLANNDHTHTNISDTLLFTVSGNTKGKRGERVKFAAVQTRKDTISARVDISQFEIDSRNVGNTNAAYKGHIHFQLDGGTFDFPQYSGANGRWAVKLGVEGRYSPSIEPTITYKNIPRGEHVLKAFLVHNDHSETGAVAEQIVTVKDR